MKENKECCICYCKVKKSFYIELLCCKHSHYCTNCIFLWWSNGNINCPLCRSDSFDFKGSIENRLFNIATRNASLETQRIKRHQIFYTSALLLYVILMICTSPLNGPMYTFMFLYTLLIIDIK